MKNWSTDITRLQKKNPARYEAWVLEQKINFGLDGERIDEHSLRVHWDKLTIDPKKRRTLSRMLWP